MASRPSLVRRFLLWWMSPPANPYVCLSLTVDFTEARAYLASLEPRDGRKVSVQHLVAGAIAHTLVRHPEANAKIFGRKLVPQDRVGLFMPVDVQEKGAGGVGRELSAAVIEEVDRKSLREITVATTKVVEAERKGQIQNDFVRRIAAIVERLPDGAMWAALDAFDRSLQQPAVAARVFASAPVTSGLSNVGSHIGVVDNVRFRGGAIALPPRIAQIGTFWGLSTIQDEVLAVDGEPEVRPCLPVILVVDHRLVDGVKMGRLVSTFAQILRAPAETFGETGDTPGPST